MQELSYEDGMKEHIAKNLAEQLKPLLGTMQGTPECMEELEQLRLDSEIDILLSMLNAAIIRNYGDVDLIDIKLRLRGSVNMIKIDLKEIPSNVTIPALDSVKVVPPELEAMIDTTEPDAVSKLYGAICSYSDRPTAEDCMKFYAALDALTAMARSGINPKIGEHFYAEEPPEVLAAMHILYNNGWKQESITDAVYEKYVLELIERALTPKLPPLDTTLGAVAGLSLPEDQIEMAHDFVHSILTGATWDFLTSHGFNPEKLVLIDVQRIAKMILLAGEVITLSLGDPPVSEQEQTAPEVKPDDVSTQVNPDASATVVEGEDHPELELVSQHSADQGTNSVEAAKQVVAETGEACSVIENGHEVAVCQPDGSVEKVDPPVPLEAQPLEDLPEIPDPNVGMKVQLFINEEGPFVAVVDYVHGGTRHMINAKYAKDGEEKSQGSVPHESVKYDGETLWWTYGPPAEAEE